MQLAYDGTDFCGWQRQRGVGRHENPKPSIEGALVAAIRDLCDEEVTVTSSGRTDAGVHASGQVAHFDLEKSVGRFSEENLRRGLMGRLPDSIRIAKLGMAHSNFKANQTSRKQYSFYFQQGPINLPHLRAITQWNRRELDHETMRHAAQALIGEHDFAAFCAGGSQVSTTVREIYEVEVTREPIPIPGCYDEDFQHLIRVRLIGSGFLKQMVRRIAGTLKRIGEGQQTANELAAILESRDRDRSCPSAPACGLWLDRVWYSKQDGIDFLDQV